ncbi:hypothetical protein [Yeosuana aromativorans]|nr:hypothetical protein [Yeosuana aromativorans]
MNYQDEIKQFVIKGYKNVHKSYLTKANGIELINREENFITIPQSDFKYHKRAGSFKSSQAFAYNIFSGIQNRNSKFEFPMPVFTSDAKIDFMMENVESNTIELYEVKAFEIVDNDNIEFVDKYYKLDKYRNQELAQDFIFFLNKTVQNFEGKIIYGGGIKQLCSHLLGILNIMNNKEYQSKKIKLFSLCFDNCFTSEFREDLESYRNAIKEFKVLVDEFLFKYNLQSRIEYYGFLSAYEYINKKRKLIGEENYNYVLKRYYYKYQG